MSQRWTTAWRAQRPSTPEPRFDPSSWTGALVIMVGAGLVVIGVQIVNVIDHYSLNRFGLYPRQVDGLWGILTVPFLQDSWSHLVYTSVSFVAIGWVLLLAGVRTWLTVTAIVLILGGSLCWLAAPDGLIVGPSGLIFGWMGYLIARAYFSRKPRWIAVAVLVVFFFGSLLGGLLPGLDSGSSWQTHVCGFAAGVLAGAVLHPRRRSGAQARRVETTPPVS